MPEQKAHQEDSACRPELKASNIDLANKIAQPNGYENHQRRALLEEAVEVDFHTLNRHLPNDAPNGGLY